MSNLINMRSALFAIFVALVWLVQSSFAQIKVGGYVYDLDLQGIPQVTVALPEYNLSITSDENGEFWILSDIPLNTKLPQFAVQAQVVELDPSINYRIYAPNGARRLLPFKEIANLANGIYYLVPGRHYNTAFNASIRVTVLNGKIVEKYKVATPSDGSRVSDGSRESQLAKTTVSPILKITKPNVLDTTVPVSSINSSTPLQINTNVKSTIPVTTDATEPPAIGPIVTTFYTDKRDGYKYRIVEIGNQSWFAENLRYDTLNNTGSRCPNNLVTNCAIYGRLYDWSTAMALPRSTNTTLYEGDDTSTEGICPEGFRIPNDLDWKALELNIGFSYAQADSINWRGADFGAHLKAKSNLWSGGARLDSYGFAALPAGYYNGSKGGAPGALTYFWSSTQTDATLAMVRGLLQAKTGVNRMAFKKDWYFAVRCVRDGSGFGVEPDPQSSSSSGGASSSSQQSSDGYFVDQRDGNGYPIVIIGNQSWMSRNMAYNPPNNPESRCVSGVDNTCYDYGRVYDYSTAKTVCPSGFRLPSEQDFKNLELNIGMSELQADSNYWRGHPFGTELKADTSIWLSGLRTNKHGFAAMPSGFYNSTEKRFLNVGSGAFFWTSTAVDSINARARVLLGANTRVFAYHYPQSMGFSVRCLRNDSLDDQGNIVVPVDSGEGFIAWEKWQHVRGAELSRINWASAPSQVGQFTSLQVPQSFDDRYGLRLRGYINAPANGEYQFSLATNMQAQVYLSFDDQPNNKQLMLTHTLTTSAKIPLKINKRYFVEIVFKEAWQAEEFALSWVTPLDPTPQVVPGKWLSPFDTGALMQIACSTITPTAHDTLWPAYCSEKAGNCGTFIDERNCREYRWTQIGTQKWMAENLDIGTKVDGSLNQTDNSAIEKYCYNNLDSMCTVYGGLYQWHEAMGLDERCMTESCWENSPKYNVQGICPEGWIVPAQSEIQNLFETINKNDTTAGSVLKIDNDLYGLSILYSGMKNNTNYIGSSNDFYMHSSEELNFKSFFGYSIGTGNKFSRIWSHKIESAKSLRCLNVKQPKDWGAFTWSKWEGYFHTLDSIPVNSNPIESGKWSIMEAPKNYSKEYSYVIKAIIIPPVSGYYTFWIYSDDYSDLTIIEKKANSTSIKLNSVTGWTYTREWTKFPNQKSQPILLDSNSKYEITIRYFEWANNESLGLAWSKPGETTANPTEIITGKYLE